MVRVGIGRADCVVGATSINGLNAPGERPE